MQDTSAYTAALQFDAAVLLKNKCKRYYALRALDEVLSELDGALSV